MMEREAVDIAMESRSRFAVDGFQPSRAEKRIIELVRDGRSSVEGLPGPGPQRDLLAWVVTLSGPGAWAEFAVDDRTGQVVRFRRSR